MRPLIVGQAPGRRGDGEPLSGQAGRRLSSLCGLSYAEYLERFERVNVLREWPGKAGKGDAFPTEEAERGAFFLRSVAFRGGREVVLLGRSVARAFGFTARAPLFRWMPEVDAVVALAPHPSGVSLWWNDPANRRDAERFWRSLAS